LRDWRAQLPDLRLPTWSSSSSASAMAARCRAWPGTRILAGGDQLGRPGLSVIIRQCRKVRDDERRVGELFAATKDRAMNAFAARSPAAIVRVDPETATLKIAAYSAI
jgi:hypothetical protein